MRPAIAIAVLVCLLSTAALCETANAECTRPRPTFDIPDGASASEQDLAKTNRELLMLDQRVGEYVSCIKGEASQKSVGKSAEERNRIASEYIAAHDLAATELAGLADCFNAQFRSFKSTGGGTTRKAADCSSYIEAAANAPADDGPVIPAGLVKEADGNTTALTEGEWGFTLIRDETPRACGPQGAQQCVARTVYVRNASPRTLECRAYITYEGTDAEGRSKIESPAVVPERSIRRVVSTYAFAGVNAQTFDAQCTPRAPLPALGTPPTCKYEVVKPVAIADYYPPAARRDGEEGPVVVEFTVGSKAANPTDVKVVGSSMFERLDRAAVEATSAMIMSSNCTDERYRLRLSFQLSE